MRILRLPADAELAEVKALREQTFAAIGPATAMAKLLGFDLCPRLADMGDRKLFEPRGIDQRLASVPVPS